jgi:peptidoglycan-associated lipoprotein
MPVSTFFLSKAGKLIAAGFMAIALSACASTNPTDPAGLGGGALPGQDGFGSNGGGGDGAGGAGGPGSQQDLASTAGDTIFFDTDSSEINAEGAAVLDAQARWLQRYSNASINLQGHADERGTREYNFALGARRAEAAKNYLSARGVERGRISTISFGKERPVEVCDDISCWSKNRRVKTSVAGAGS